MIDLHLKLTPFSLDLSETVERERVDVRLEVVPSKCGSEARFIFKQ